jgi:hypothetical protein
MRNFFLILVLLFLFGYVKKGISQDTINLLSGKRIEAKVNKIDDDKDGYVSYDLKKRNKIKSKFIEKEDVYSISYYNKNMEIVYKIDSARGFILNNDQMYNYIIGEQVAYNNYKTSKLIIAGGVFTGVAGGFLGLYGLLLPVSYITTMSLIDPKIEYINTKLPSQESIEYYKMGYTSVAKSKNIKNSIIAGFSGVVASTVIISVFHIYPFSKK